ncbi:MFS transporter [Pedobacter duraquae]|uniref:EmrB/QacA subfamily drug resistance transporter n=1 Tax=Pedobacter duraquae TaxID=425511 RepID=A0A4R6IK44_9SPHI|nr:MFS transporter [Pedobacter duraquae]TDO22393.1 EmrB/QacA subfamily drug resistance transporter [Pedobacter duraquae]
MATVKLSSVEGRWIMVSAILASAMAFIDGTALNVVLPALQLDLHASAMDLFWVLNAYLLVLASLILIGGAMGDRYGRKKVFMLGILIFIAGSTACGFAQHVTLLVIFRALQGIGGALMIPGSLSLISSGIAEKERGRAIGTWSAFTTIVTMGGPILGGALADAGLWRYIFFINVPIGLVTLLMLSTKVKESADGQVRGRLDFGGALTIALALAMLTFGFLRVPVLGIVHLQTLGMLVAGFALLILFIRIESRHENPMMPLSLFRNSIFSGANLLTFFLYAGLGAGMLFLSLNLVQVQGYSQLQSGFTFLPFTVLMVLIARFAGKLADKYGPRWFLIAGPAVAGLGMLLLSLVAQTAGPAAYWSTFFPGVLVLGLGMSFTVAPLTTAVMGAVHEELSGTASGVNNAMTRIASVFANAIFGALAVLFFVGVLKKDLANLPLTESQRIGIIAEAKNLGDAKVPESVNPEIRSRIIRANKDGFIHAYQMVMRISCILALTGAVMAVVFIKPRGLSKNNVKAM